MKTSFIQWGFEITLSGAPGDDAKHYQERDLKRAIQKVQS
jgi:hypothetical protein